MQIIDQVIAKTNIFSRASTFLVGLLALLVIPPFFIHNQFITGPLVNAILLSSAVIGSGTVGVTYGLLPSTIALTSGLLPSPLAPMVPFIMLGNAIYVVIFKYFYAKNTLIAIFTGSIAKFAFLNACVFWVLPNLLKNKFLSKVAVMMSWPQLVTAVVGGVIALGIIKKYQQK